MADELEPSPILDEPVLPSSTGLPPNIAATIACAVPLFGGIAFLILEKSSPLVRFHAMQAVIFAIASILISFSLEMVAAMFHHVPVLGSIMLIFVLLLKFGFGLGWLLVWLITVFKAFCGIAWEIPYLGPLARKQLAGKAVTQP